MTSNCSSSRDESVELLEPSLLRLLVPSNCLGAIIGHRGESVNETSALSGTKIDIVRDDPAAGHMETLIEIRGRSTDSIALAVGRILEDIYKKILSKWQKRAVSKSDLEEDAADDVAPQHQQLNRRIVNFYLRFLVSNNLVGQIIGKEGRNITSLRDQTDTQISVSTMFEIKGYSMERTVTVKQLDNNIDKIVSAFSLMFSRIRSIKKRSIEFGAAGDPQIDQSSISYRCSETDDRDAADMSMLASWLSQFQAAPHFIAAQSSQFPPQQQQPSSYIHHHQQQFQHHQPPPVNQLGFAPPPTNNEHIPRSFPLNPYINQRTQRLNRNESVVVHIPYYGAGVIIGRRGSSIRNIIKSTGATIRISPAARELTENADGFIAQKVSNKSRQVMIRGKPEAQFRAQYTIFHMLTDSGFAGHEFDKLADMLGEIASENPTNSHLKTNGREIVLVVEFYVPYESVGRIIGKSGVRVRGIERGTGSLVRFISDSNNRVECITPDEMADSTIPELNQGPEGNQLFAVVYVIGTFNCCYAAQRYIRQIVDDNNGNKSFVAVEHDDDDKQIPAIVEGDGPEN